MRRSVLSACRQALAAGACKSESSIIGSPAYVTASWSLLVRGQPRPEQLSALQQCRALSSGAGPSSAQREAIEKMIDMMVRTPALQQMMMAALPSNMRRPEVLQAMFNNPQTRSQIVDMIARQGMSLPPEVLQRLGDTGGLEQSLAQAEEMGLSPQEMFRKLLNYPVLMQKFQDPRVVRAFLDIAQNPDHIHEYQDQPDIIEVYFKAKEVLLPKQEKPFSAAPPEQLEGGDASGSASSSSSSSGGGGGGGGSQEQPAVVGAGTGPSSSPQALPGISGVLGIGSDELLQQLLANPKAVEALSKPKVQEALREAAGSKWKMLKHMFDPDVRAAVQELQKLVDSSQKSGSK